MIYNSMLLHHTSRFRKELKKLSPQLRKQVKKKLALFIQYGSAYPSLRFKPFQKYKILGVYELSVTKNYRIIAQKITDDEFYLLQVGSHSILDKFTV